jgi:hypothetical protein
VVGYAAGIVMAVERPERKKKARSPSYPGIGLEAAIERARTLYAVEKRNAVPVETAMTDWGYSPKASSGLVVLAALKKFGLLIDEGSGTARKARLSDLALDIVLDEREDSPDRQRLIQDAALRPTIHSELWQKYGGNLPSDSALRYELRKERNFTDTAVAEFIPQFRATLAFAGLTGDGAQNRSVGVPEDRHSPSTTLAAGAVGSGVMRMQASIAREMHLPIAPDEYATIRAVFPLTEMKWNQMLTVLTAMKPALVTPEAPKPAASEQLDK